MAVSYGLLDVAFLSDALGRALAAAPEKGLVNPAAQAAELQGAQRLFLLPHVINPSMSHP